MKLIFVRHGESEANLLRVFSNRGLKHPLTANGVLQAQTLAHSLSGWQVARIYTSPILRAVQTAQILSASLDAPLQTTPALYEWSAGIYEGTTDPAGWDWHARVQEDWFIRHRYDSKMPGGESFNEIQARFTPFINGLLEDERLANQNIFLVAHGGLYLAMLPVIFTNIDFAFARQHGFPYTAYALAEPRADGLYCRSWCGVLLDGHINETAGQE
jgi:broad specificity phosphatase PhoE